MPEGRFHPADRDDALLGKEDADVLIFNLECAELSRLRHDEHMIRVKVHLCQLSKAHRVFDSKLMQTEGALQLADVIPIGIDHVNPGKEIGRASCRERVCQYV